MDINPFEVTSRHNAARPGFMRRARRAVSLLQIDSFLDRTLLSLSNGERQRVQLARALCHPLRLLILDEPFVGLDAETRKHFLRVLEELMDTPLRVLLVTTREEDLPHHVSHLVKVENCEVVASGPRKEILEGSQPKTITPGIAKQFKSQKSKNLVSTRTSRKRAGEGVQSVPPGNELIRLRRVTVRYGDNVVLQNLDWTVRAGESWALLGPNGSGKTTLLSLISGDHPQAYMNEVVVFGKARGGGESIWDLKKKIGWVSPELHLHFDDSLDCLEAVASGFRDTIGVFEKLSSRQRAVAREWLARFDLLDFASDPLFALSAGQQRMVLLARALVKKPRLLILDEPCQGLDVTHRKLFVDMVDALIRDEAVTVLYVTHRLDEIPRSIQRVLRLPVGARAQDSSPYYTGV
ncbi:MAG TPA: ATP-binding cassette domain-containing protein, partial [Clostridia bacterium]|nr:ATP-binding cassette domain-containing protein [Clostridia bacterium]